MRDLNEVTIEGIICNDIELRYAKNGTPYCKFVIATTVEDWQRENVNYFRCIAWGEKCNDLVGGKKGEAVRIEGFLKQLRWKEGKHWSDIVMIVVDYALRAAQKTTQGDFNEIG